MKSSSGYRTSSWAVLPVALLLNLDLAAQPVRDKMLDQVYITVDDGHPAVHVSLTFPFRYLSHFPASNGSELRIRVKPVRVPVSDGDAVFRREGVRPEGADTVGLVEVVYEGDIAGGPYISLIFSHEVAYSVNPGTDYRHLSVSLEPVGD